MIPCFGTPQYPNLSITVPGLGWPHNPKLAQDAPSDSCPFVILRIGRRGCDPCISLKSAPARKSALADVENDLTLLQPLLTLRSEYVPTPTVVLKAKQTSQPLPLEPPPVKADPLP